MKKVGVYIIIIDHINTLYDDRTKKDLSLIFYSFIFYLLLSLQFFIISIQVSFMYVQRSNCRIFSFFRLII